MLKAGPPTLVFQTDESNALPSWALCIQEHNGFDD